MGPVVPGFGARVGGVFRLRRDRTRVGQLGRFARVVVSRVLGIDHVIAVPHAAGLRPASPYCGLMNADTTTGLRQRVLRWLPTAALALAGAYLLAPGERDLVSVTVGIALLVVAMGFSPLFFPRSLDDATAHTAAAARGLPLIYWRPGCVYCFRMRIALGMTGSKAVWVDVSRDARASARVREVNGGNETVPTVFVGDDAHVNPSPSWVRSVTRG